MNPKDTIGDKMKARERIHEDALPARTYSIVRVDGRAFHTYTKGLERPFDPDFAAAMDYTATELLKEIPGAQFAYVQSDEISVLITDFTCSGTQQWFGGEVQKIVSITAAVATAAFNEKRPGKRALFDSRVFTLPTHEDVLEYFGWRQFDAQRNAAQSLGQSLFSRKEMHGLKTGEVLRLAADRGVVWDDLPLEFRNGRIAIRETYEEEVTFLDGRSGELNTTLAERHRWVALPAPALKHDAQSWEELVPAHPDHARTAEMLF